MRRHVISILSIVTTSIVYMPQYISANNTSSPTGFLDLISLQHNIEALYQHTPPKEMPTKKCPLKACGCSGPIIGSLNAKNTCYMNAVTPFIFALCCDETVWAYIHKVSRAQRKYRFAPLYTAVYHFIEHYQEPRVRYDEAKEKYVPLPGQKYADALARELAKLDKRLSIDNGGYEYLSLLYMLESLFYAPVSLNFSLQQSRIFTLPAGIFMATFWLKNAGEYEKEQQLLTTLEKKYPGKTWLERFIMHQTSEKIGSYTTDAWPRHLFIVDYDTGGYVEPSPTTEESQESYEEEADYLASISKTSTFPLTLNMKDLGLSTKDIIYACHGLTLSSPSHGTSMLLHDETWYWCDDEIVESGETIATHVQSLSSTGKFTSFDAIFIAGPIFYYKRIN